MINKLLCLLLFSTQFVSLYCQQTDDQSNVGIIVPPSPTSATLAKYGDIPVNYATGIPNISIPLWEIKSGSLTVPISLSYYAGGIKVDDIASWVGLGWSLNAGGVISRSVNGLPDESSYGFLYQGKSITPPLDETNSNDFNYLRNVAEGNLDLQPDQFSYNFGQYTGQFVFGNDGKVHLMPYSGLDIQTDPSLDYFQVCSENGTTYLFDQKEVTEVDDKYTKSARFTCTTSWYLSKIVSADKADTIYFSYKTHYNLQYDIEHNSNIQCLINQDYIGASPYPPGDCNPMSFYGACSSEVYQGSTLKFLSALKLDQIKSKNCRVRFTTSSDNERLDIPGDLYLEGISIASHNESLNHSNILAGQSVVWPSEKPIRTFNFKYTYFISDNTVTNNPLNYRLRLDEVDEIDNLILGIIHPYKFDYDPTPLPMRLSYSKDYWGYPNGIPNLTAIPNITYKGIVLSGGDRSVNPQYCLSGLLKTINYPTGGNTTFTFEPNTFIPIDPDSQVTTFKHVIIKKLTEAGSVDPNEITAGDDGTICTGYITIPEQAKNVSFNVMLSQCLDQDGNPQSAGTTCYDNTGKVIIQNKPKDQPCASATIICPDQTITFSSNTVKDQDLTINNLPGQYSFCVSAYYNSNINATASLEWDEPVYLSQGFNYGGGARIKEIENFDGSTSVMSNIN